MVKHQNTPFLLKGKEPLFEESPGRRAIPDYVMAPRALPALPVPAHPRGSPHGPRPWTPSQPPGPPAPAPGPLQQGPRPAAHGPALPSHRHPAPGPRADPRPGLRERALGKQRMRYNRQEGGQPRHRVPPLLSVGTALPVG